ncbi:MAG TPA: solute carrier family 23 protein [Candidatus Limnocylindria bacterium]|nr:solute carrier family 23 protein [Candidatus Limnocylindria bacterium]
MTEREAFNSYLPDERPPIGKLLLYALQQVIVMFPATVAVALITGFQVSTTIFASGLATVAFILITGRKIPMYYGSSFAYLTAIFAMLAAKGLSPDQLYHPGTNILLPQHISEAQFGIIFSGLVSIAAGLLVRVSGKGAVEKILPAQVTGPIAMIIGLTLAGNAIRDAAPVAAASNALKAAFDGFMSQLGVAGGAAAVDAVNASVTSLGEGVAQAMGSVPARTVFNTGWVWVVSLSTLFSTMIFSRYLKGLLGQLPLLLGAAFGCAVAGIIYAVGGPDMNLFRQIPQEALNASIWKLGDGGIFALPAFTLPRVSWAAVAAIMPIAIATIPESTAHIYQLDIYVNNEAKKKGKHYPLSGLLDRNLIGDGICDMISGAVGGPAGTNYGENISTMAITRVFSIPVMMAAGIIAMVVSCFTPLIKVIYGIPIAVIGGLEIYLFGAIAAQGIAIMIDKGVSMFSAKNIAVIAVITTFGLGVNYFFGGNIDMFGIKVPAVAGAAVLGILTNYILSIGDRRTGAVAEQ